MCGPLLAPLTAMFSTVGGPLALLGGVVSGVAGYSARRTEARNYDNAAVAAENRALQAREVGIDRTQQVRREIESVTGTQRAAAAEAGLAMAGSVLDTQKQSISEADLDIQSIRYQSGQEVWAAKTDANTNRDNARRSRRAAPLAFLAPVLNSATRFA